MYTTGPSRPDPGVWMQSFLSNEICQKENKWQSRNIYRWRNKEFDDLHAEAESELDPVKRAAMYIAMNDLVIKHRVVLPIVYRPGVSAANLKLQHVSPSGWDSNFWELHNWYKDA
jgi:peptide/nickel transport system substrate-binding protein